MNYLGLRVLKKGHRRKLWLQCRLKAWIYFKLRSAPPETLEMSNGYLFHLLDCAGSKYPATRVAASRLRFAANGASTEITIKSAR